jgi:hypothetical protein
LKEHLHFLSATELAHTLFIDWRKCFAKSRRSLQKTQSHCYVMCSCWPVTHLGSSDLFVRLTVKFSFCLAEETTNSLLCLIQTFCSITEQWDDPSNVKTSPFVVQ